MNISNTSNINSPVVTPYNKESVTSQPADQANQAQSVDTLPTEQPVQKATELNKDMVNARVSEYQNLSSGNPVTADEAVGSLIDVRI